MGFTFDDSETKDVASPTSAMRSLIAKDPRNAQRIFPYIGGQEILNSPTQEHHRFIINFEDMTESEARRWPDLMAIVEEKVKPSRIQDNREAYRKHWWQFAEKRTDLMRALAGMHRTLAHPFTSSNLCFAFVPSSTVVSGPHTVLLFEDYNSFAVLQSRAHEAWTRFFASSLKDDLRYTLGDCFCTFPFPAHFETNVALEKAGTVYYEFRAALMVRNNEGLTKTYNRFHDPEETSPDILRLRELHAAMDRAVLEAYGWPDLIPQCQCEFLLDYEDEEDGAEETGRRRKKPWRFRWPDLVRDEVLARLLKLNAERAQEELLSGAAAARKKKPTNPRAKAASAAPAQGEIIPGPQSDLFV
jgi:hypothetical protein